MLLMQCDPRCPGGHLSSSLHVHPPRIYTYPTYAKLNTGATKILHPLEQMRKNAPLLPNKDPQKSKNVYLISRF